MDKQQFEEMLRVQKGIFTLLAEIRNEIITERLMREREKEGKKE